MFAQVLQLIDGLRPKPALVEKPLEIGVDDLLAKMPLEERLYDLPQSGGRHGPEGLLVSLALCRRPDHRRGGQRTCLHCHEAGRGGKLETLERQAVRASECLGKPWERLPPNSLG